MFSPLTLKDSRPLIESARRFIFQHPHDERLLVKVLKPEMRTDESTQKVPWLRINRRYGIYRTYARQIGEYIRLRAELDEHPLPIERVFGVVDTEFGLGLVVEKICGRDGQLAPTLSDLVRRHGFTREIEQRVLQLRDEVIRQGIITGDLHSRNIVSGYDPVRGDYLVIVDGIGDKTFIPVNSLSRFINRMSNIRHFEHVINGLRRLDAHRRRAAETASG